MKNNYPIKYATMPIYEQTCWNSGLNELERGYGVVAYIVSKCYVINEQKQYLYNGDYNISYQVVFPYKKDNQFPNEWIRVEPEFNYSREYTNSVIVEETYDNYVDALEKANAKNKQILCEQIAKLPSEKIIEEMDKVKQQFNDKIEKYKILQVLIEEKTSDLKVNSIKKEQSIIVIDDDKDIVVDLSIYDYINLFHEPFYVCNVSIEDYDLMKKQIKNSMLDERSPRNTKVEYDMFRYLLASDSKNKIIRIADCDSENDKGCFYLKDDSMYYDKEMYQFHKDPAFSRQQRGKKIYTTETYEDIIKSYIPKYVSKDDDTNIGGFTMCKRMVLK